MKEELRKNRFRLWLALAGAVTFTIGTSYALTQQATRLAADDLPLSLSQNAKQEIESGADASDVVPALKTDLRTNNNAFVIVTDDSYHVVASSATLNNKTPLPPKGVFEFTKKHGIDQFTWEPASGVRLATNVSSYKDGLIITGQSLKPAQDRVEAYTAIAVAGWLTSLIWLSVVLLMPTSGVKRTVKK